MNSKNIKTEFMGTPLMVDLSKQMLGRVFNGTGKAIDGLRRN